MRAANGQGTRFSPGRARRLTIILSSYTRATVLFQIAFGYPGKFGARKRAGFAGAFPLHVQIFRLRLSPPKSDFDSMHRAAIAVQSGQAYPIFSPSDGALSGVDVQFLLSPTNQFGCAVMELSSSCETNPVESAPLYKPQHRPQAIPTKKSTLANGASGLRTSLV